jgi:hypothetical protein
MIWGGETEILIDSIQKFAKTIQTGFVEADPRHVEQTVSTSRERFTFVVTPEHGHDEMILDHILGRLTMGQGAKDIENWLSTILG